MFSVSSFAGGSLRHRFNYSPIVGFLPVVFFWAMFDFTLAYLLPILMEHSGFSVLIIGLLISTSSMWGALFDVILSIFSRTNSYRRQFGYLFLVCSFVPIMLFASQSWIMFLIVMALWGIYYDLYTFGIYKFITHIKIDNANNTTNFGLVSVIKAIAAVMTPILIEVFVFDGDNIAILFLMYFFLGLSVLSFYFHRQFSTKAVEHEIPVQQSKLKLSIRKELKVLLRVEKTIKPVLIAKLFLDLVDSFFWTLGPIISVSLSVGNPFGALFISAYMIPSLFVGFWVGKLVNPLGKKRTACGAILTSSLLFVLLPLITNTPFLILIVFLASILNSIAWPAIDGTLADYIEETPIVEGEIEGLQDFSGNLGYVIGPICAGLFATFSSNLGAFAIMGIVGAVLAVYLFIVTPRKITVVIS
ncbi:hypothetical protein CO180_04610 [candidate division WWE3 bacterium CG_4_9_14_3_um_filter_41_6]|uniref:Major facilitator superfamily (MFS) profile domain-containing protein n=1 Tax=candidate division WWE3 bacterium CG_4_10_14_0_2_um_filter_41_14 TaxID=1975072 RepID=A0A2M7TLR7_UNCKA|nr:MAG: hypothetical protein COY32_00585 [candidate division WWE3 bacterium CG_4_10_14_0_2_um_filter_41_14]PJA37928.1 MAG: hypothetical protein CO180_04610 [candidate division WWE3 bacterium CG_4_9_14_3_um_filter_41_6]